MNKIDNLKIINKFKLNMDSDSNDKPPSDRKWWRREGIYLSDVCLAVHILPSVSSFSDANETELAKEALYTYLRRVSHAALEHNLMRPVACVLSEGTHKLSKNLLNTIRGWGGDQEWHRGSFTLYVEVSDSKQQSNNPSKNHWDRLADLLNPKIEALTLAPREEHSIENILKRVGKLLEERPPAGTQAIQLIHDLIENIKNIQTFKESQDKQVKEGQDKQVLDGWKTMIENKAGRISNGG